MAYKVFTNGSTLQASELNENLMQQSIAVFSNAAARTSAITSPVEGQVTYLEDSNSYQYWNNGWIGLVPQSANAIINGGFDIWQRGTSFTLTGTAYTYTADRWDCLNISGATTTVSRQTFTPGTAPVSGYEGQFFLRYATTDTSVGHIVRQKIEDVRSFAGQIVTISFWAKVATGTRTLNLNLIQNFGSGGSGDVQTVVPFSDTTITTDWKRFTGTVSVLSVAGKTIGAGSFVMVPIQVAAGNNTLDIWGVQLEAGPVATPFRRNATSLQGELAACQRYYYRASSSNATQPTFGVALFQSSTASLANVDFPVSMRRDPTAIDFASLEVGRPGVGAYAVSGVGLNTNLTSTKVGSLSLTGFTSGAAQGAVGLFSASLATGFIGFSAEL